MLVLFFLFSVSFSQQPFSNNFIKYIDRVEADECQSCYSSPSFLALPPEGVSLAIEEYLNYGTANPQLMPLWGFRFSLDIAALQPYPGWYFTISIYTDGDTDAPGLEDFVNDNEVIWDVNSVVVQENYGCNDNDGTQYSMCAFGCTDPSCTGPSPAFCEARCLGEKFYEGAYRMNFRLSQGATTLAGPYEYKILARGETSFGDLPYRNRCEGVDLMKIQRCFTPFYDYGKTPVVRHDNYCLYEGEDMHEEIWESNVVACGGTNPNPEGYPIPPTGGPSPGAGASNVIIIAVASTIGGIVVLGGIGAVGFFFYQRRRNVSNVAYQMNTTSKETNTYSTNQSVKSARSTSSRKRPHRSSRKSSGSSSRSSDRKRSH